MDLVEEPVLRDVAPGAELPEDWLATVMRAALQEWAEGIEPPPHTWDRIRRRIQALVPSLPLQGEIGTRGHRDV